MLYKNHRSSGNWLAIWLAELTIRSVGMPLLDRLKTFKNVAEIINNNRFYKTSIFFIVGLPQLRRLVYINTNR